MAATANGDSFANQRSNSTEKTLTESFSPEPGKAWLSIFRAAIAKTPLVFRLNSTERQTTCCGAELPPCNESMAFRHRQGVPQRELLLAPRPMRRLAFLHIVPVPLRNL